MDIRGKSVLILGGYGLVGQAVARRLLQEQPRELTLLSLKQDEAQEAVESVRSEADGRLPARGLGRRVRLQRGKDRPRREVYGDRALRARMIESLIDPLSEAAAAQYYLYQLITERRPDIIVDAVNTATGIAYQDIYKTSRNAYQTLKDGGDLRESLETLLVTDSLPQLIRHVQVLYQAMLKAETRAYFKIGTSGTGGMGLNIPYTHSEEKPSRVLLSKSALAGAHTLLLFLMARTPDGPIIKEIKPAAAIAWKRIGYGEVRRGGRPVPLYDVDPAGAQPLAAGIDLPPPRQGAGHGDRGDAEERVHRHRRERHLLARGVQRHHHRRADGVRHPGGDRGRAGARAAGRQHRARRHQRARQRGHGPHLSRRPHAALGPREAARPGGGARRALRRLREPGPAAAEQAPLRGARAAPRPRLHGPRARERRRRRCRAAAAARDLGDADLRQNILSIGIPILLPDGRLLRGPECKIPPRTRDDEAFEVTPERVEAWAGAGWVDLRLDNMARWQERFRRIRAEMDGISARDTSSRFLRDRQFWGAEEKIQPGKIVGWIFATEEKGARMK